MIALGLFLTGWNHFLRQKITQMFIVYGFLDIEVTANKTLHWTAIPLRFIAAGELGR